MNKAYIGCDLGGTNLRAGIVDPATGQVTYRHSVPSLAREGHEAVMKRIAGLIEDVVVASGLSKAEIGGVGIGAPGVLDLERGLTIFLPNLPGTWPEVPLRDTIASYTNLPVALLNDVRSITYGEWKFGAGQGVDTIACFAVGTGIGGGLVLNGQLHLGIGGTGGELGHQIIDYNGPKCGCGNHGCLEALASGPAIAAMGIKAVVQGLTTSLRKMVDYDVNKITPSVIAEAAAQGDEIAQGILEEAGYYIGIAAANVCVSIGPRKIVIAGGVSNIGEPIIAPIRKTIQERVTVMPVEQVEVIQAQLGGNAGVIGTALWAAQNFG
jgi:glucokinase